MNKISNKPPKGTSDWFPEEFAIRKYIFDTWRKVCTQFGYEEYLSPILESADIYRAKSGEDVGGKELMTMTDRAGRELAIRPEMTPSITRMITQIYNDTPKPIRMFSIANFFRNEKPQRGRNREFWQLNFDIFGSDSINADIEILQMAFEIMRVFGADDKQFVIKINDRNILELLIRSYLGIPDKNFNQAIRMLDKFAKISLDEFVAEITKLEVNAYIDNEFWNTFAGFMNGSPSSSNEIIEKYIKGSDSYKSFEKILQAVKDRGLDKYIKWDPTLARGFDYYDGTVFEVFDKHPDNNRAMFGGGRYNGLASIFGSNSFPAVGCAPGDETTRIFLESWGLLDRFKEIIKGKQIYVPILSEILTEDIQTISKTLREKGSNVIIGLEVQRLGKALEFADKKKIEKVVIFGEDEKSRGVYKIKDMRTGEEEEVKL
jgi:histidyl-tRNA synthetase